MAGKFYDWRHGSIRYIRRGFGDPLLLVHNLYPGASLEEFEYNLSELARHYTVYAIDLLGFGESDAPSVRYSADLYADLIADFIEDVIDQRTSVMSAGVSCGYVAQVAVDRPELIDKLVLVCPRSEPTVLGMPHWMARLQRFLLTTKTFGSGFYDTMTGDFELQQFLKHCFHNPRHVTRDKVERLKEHASRPGSSLAYVSLITGFLDADLLSSLPKVTSPVLLIWGRQARPTPVEHSVRLAALTRHCRLESIEEAGAWPHDEQSAKVNKLVDAFLAEPVAVPSVA